MKERKRKINEIKPVREIYIEIKFSGEIIDITENCINFIGYKRENVIGKNINFFSLKIFQLDFIINEEENIFIFKNAKGQNIYFDIRVINNCKDSIILSLIDVTIYKKNEKKLDNLVKIFENSKDIIYSLQVYPEVKFIYISPSVKESLGYTVEENMENPFICCENTHPEFKDLQYSKLCKDTDFSKPIVTRIKSKITGEYVWQEDFVTPFFDESGNLIKINGVCRSIQERKELEEELTYISYHDSLTGLYNRNYMDIKMCEYNNYKDEKIGIAVFDLDNLKCFNDELGHTAGDSLIIKTAKILKASIKDHPIFRFGGDEFVIIFENITLEEMKMELRRLTEGIEKYNSNELNVKINISMGYAYTNNSLGKLNKLFKAADDNMYSNKDIRKMLKMT